MGKVLVKFEVMPESAEYDIEKLKVECANVLKEYGEVAQNDAVPVAFGLKKLMIVLVIPDQGGVDEMEAKLSEVDGVDRAEAIDVRLMFG